MEPFIKHTGIAALLDRMNVDTDQIIPKQFLKSIARSGYGPNLFYNWRYLDGKPNPDFELNRPKYAGASILVAGDNFGCGSSREHAPWAIRDYGICVIIAPSFADIFFENCFKNGLLAIPVGRETYDQLRDHLRQAEPVTLSVDLTTQQVTSDKGFGFSFTVNPKKRANLLAGIDEIGEALQKEDLIAQFELDQQQRLPWLWPNLPSVPPRKEECFVGRDGVRAMND